MHIKGQKTILDVNIHLPPCGSLLYVPNQLGLSLRRFSSFHLIQKHWDYPRAAPYLALCLCSGDLSSGLHTLTRGARFLSRALPRSTSARLKRTPMNCLTVWRLEAHSKAGQAAFLAGSRGGQPPPLFASSQFVVVASSPC